MVPGYSVRLRDADGGVVQGAGEGAMEVAGLSNARMYWNQPDKTAETMRGGWIQTGDRFRVDEDGFYFFLGRADDLVKVSGQWVWPHEIELTLADHPSVHECAVMAEALPDQRITIVAYVVTNKDATPGDMLTGELQAFAKTKLLPYKYPRVVHYLAALPKTGTGKIDRQKLRGN